MLRQISVGFVRVKQNDYPSNHMPGVGLMVRVVGFGSEGPEFKSRSAVELIPRGVNSACHPKEVGKMSATMLVSSVGVATCPGLCPRDKAAPTLCKENGPNILLLLEITCFSF